MNVRHPLGVRARKLGICPYVAAREAAVHFCIQALARETQETWRKLGGKDGEGVLQLPRSPKRIAASP